MGQADPDKTFHFVVEGTNSSAVLSFIILLQPTRAVETEMTLVAFREFLAVLKSCLFLEKYFLFV